MLLHPAGHHRAYVQIVADLLRVYLFPFVAKHGGSRHNAKIGELREVVDNALADSVAQVFGIGIGASVDEGQHGQRVNRLPAPADESEPCCRAEECSQSESARHQSRFSAPPWSGSCSEDDSAQRTDAGRVRIALQTV